MKKILWILLTFISTQLFAQKITSIKIERTPCYGKCPTYSIELLSDGKMIYNGKSNVKKLGLFDAKISKSKATNFMKQYEKNNFNTLKPKYTVLVTDLPSLNIEVVVGGKRKIIQQADAGPAFLRQIGADMDLLSEEQNWIGREGSEVVENPLNPNSITPDDIVYEFVPAQYPGGENALNDFLIKNIGYPNIARVNKIEGNVVCRFIVTEKGAVKNVEVTKGIGYACDDEAMRVIEMMPHWNPGMLNGKVVKTYQTLTIPFKQK